MRQTLDAIEATGQPRLVVLNKIDQLEDATTSLLPWLRDYPDALPISASDGRGLETLTHAVREILVGPVADVRLVVQLADGATVDFIEKRTVVKHRDYGDGVVRYECTMGRRQMEQLRARGAQLEIDGAASQEAADSAWGGGGSVDSPPPHQHYPSDGGV